MIISHKHKFIFIKTRKTAGTALEIALSAICGPNDVITPLSGTDEDLRFELSGKRAQNCQLPLSSLGLEEFLRWLKHGKRPRHVNHQSALLTRDRVGKKCWEDYFTFTVERDPLDKVVSHYQWLKMQKQCKSPEEYHQKKFYKKIQASALYADRNGEILVDSVYIQCQLEKVTSSLAKKLNLPQSDFTLPPQRVKESKAVSQEELTALHMLYQQHLKQEFALEAGLLKDKMQK
ncbi:sulfotransferase family 2 domain-containing protein [Gilvibacter sp.]|uniref:sulfotransferase family 2 domain-containing protein n=1 Tax=Gilvibacter sp. TaxID=2729997 RepID=UPI0025BE3294|nr:sulfotransferase family 2 domain-containing protein [Gilvibacter sp.]NQX76877.1 hypothetical protein [Gilvibacter sp.]